ncbi:S-layer homology domain-containing protein [Paenibacillus sp. P26]|nr:S-layer homology domain-containing protein [Paenibacillus sp. P26]
MIIARAMQLKLTANADTSLANLSKMFTDATGVNTYAVPSVEAVAKAGLMDGEENTLLPGQKKATFRFSPIGNLTRAQAAEIVHRILVKLKKI